MQVCFVILPAAFLFVEVFSQSSYTSSRIAFLEDRILRSLLLLCSPIHSHIRCQVTTTKTTYGNIMFRKPQFVLKAAKCEDWRLHCFQNIIRFPISLRPRFCCIFTGYAFAVFTDIGGHRKVSFYIIRFFLILTLLGNHTIDIRYVTLFQSDEQRSTYLSARTQNSRKTSNK